MTAAFPDLAAIAVRMQRSDDDRWARLRLVAAAIPDDIDLSDEADVIRALFLARFCAADVLDVLDDALARAAENRKLRTQ